MKPHRPLSILISLIMILGLFTSASAKPSTLDGGINPASFVPWEVKTVDSSSTEGQVSVAHGGTHQYPLVTISQGDPTLGYVTTEFRFPEVGMVGDCGAGGNWVCMPIIDPDRPTKASHMAVHQFTNSFKVSWLVNIQGSRWLTLNTYELTDNLVLTSSEPIVQNIVDMNYVKADDGSTVSLLEHSVPSLAFDEFGNPHMAFLMHTSVGRDTLMYAYKKLGGKPNHPCSADSNTQYQCDFLIYPNLDVRLSNYVSITLDPYRRPYIGFMYRYNPNNYLPEGPTWNYSLGYAYQAEFDAVMPNCGPELNLQEKSWRCTLIESSLGSHQFVFADVLPEADMAVGTNRPYFIYKTSTDGNAQPRLRIAEYVENGGNCGREYDSEGFLDYRWSCKDIIITASQYTPAYFDFSLEVDTLNYPVIAYTDVGLYTHPYFLFPSERAGLPSLIMPWRTIKLDGAQYDSGYGIDLTLSNGDLGLVGFVELDDHGSKLKIVYQDAYKTFLPAVRR